MHSNVRDALQPVLQEALRGHEEADWMLRVITTGLDRDPVDAASDAEAVLALLDARCTWTAAGTIASTGLGFPEARAALDDPGFSYWAKSALQETAGMGADQARASWAAVCRVLQVNCRLAFEEVRSTPLTA